MSEPSTPKALAIVHKALVREECEAPELERTEYVFDTELLASREPLGVQQLLAKRGRFAITAWYDPARKWWECRTIPLIKLRGTDVYESLKRHLPKLEGGREG